jgi:DNA polymerase I-like protein with 3'-5' exonuclease and polymerase domains
MKTKTKTIPFNPGSRQQIADRLIKRGWEPEGRTDTGQVKVDESTLETAQHIQGVDKLLEYFLLEKRVGAVENWNKAVTPQGLIHGRVDTLGTGTHRCSHSKPNLAQVPSNGSPYGKDCRALFYAPDGFDMLGCDVSRLELMMLAHYMDDPAFSEVLLTGDVHTLLAESYGVPRGPGKNVTYAMIYGAGLEKLGVTADPSLGTKALRVARGKAIMANLEKRLPALPKLQARIKEVAARTKTVTLIDGRKIPVRSEHSALNFLLQGGGAVVCKKWVCNFHAVKPASVQQVLYVHDELQMLVPTGMGEEVGHLCVSSITKAGQDLGVKLPLTGEFNVGKNWAETH